MLRCNRLIFVSIRFSLPTLSSCDTRSWNENALQRRPSSSCHSTFVLHPPLECLDVPSSKSITCGLVLRHTCSPEPRRVSLGNHAIVDDRLSDEPHSINQKKSSPGPGEAHPRHSPNGRNKRLLTKDIMSGEWSPRGDGGPSKSSSRCRSGTSGQTFASLSADRSRIDLDLSLQILDLTRRRQPREVAETPFTVR